MLSTIDILKCVVSMKSTNSHACEAWELLLKFFFSQRADLPTMAAEFELSPAQCHLLNLIDPDQPTSMGRLAETLACDASNMTGLVDRLESRGLVRRCPSSEDRRVKVLELTPAGGRLRAVVLDRMSKPPQSLGRLSQDEQQAVVRVVRGLLDERCTKETGHWCGAGLRSRTRG